MLTEQRLYDIISDQQEHWDRPLGISRSMLQNFEIAHNKATVITGIRRAGKSTLLRQIGHQCARDLGENNPDFLYLHFFDERLSDLTNFDQILEVFFQRNDNPKKIKGRISLFFDEISLLPRWEKFISRLIESEKYLILPRNCHGAFNNTANRNS